MSPFTVPMDDDTRTARGHRAFNELQEVGDAFDRVEAALLKSLAETPVGADVKVLKLHMAVQNLAAVRQALREVIDDGRVAEHAIAVAGLTRPT
jgi:hypothetical protein